LSAAAARIDWLTGSTVLEVDAAQCALEVGGRACRTTTTGLQTCGFKASIADAECLLLVGPFVWPKTVTLQALFGVAQASEIAARALLTSKAGCKCVVLEKAWITGHTPHVLLRGGGEGAVIPRIAGKKCALVASHIVGPYILHSTFEQIGLCGASLVAPRARGVGVYIKAV